MNRQLELSLYYCNNWVVSQEKIKKYQDKINEIDSVIYQFDDEYEFQWHNGLRGPMGWLTMIKRTAICAFILFGIIITALINTSLPLHFEYTFNRQLDFSLVVCVIIIVSTLVNLLIAINDDKEYENDFTNLKAFKKQAEDEILPKLYQLRDTEKKVTQGLEYNMTTGHLCIIPRKYWRYADIICSYIHDKRAITLTEAINLLEFEKRQEYNTRLIEQTEQHARETKEYARITAENSAIAAEEAERAADNAGMAAFFSALAYYEAKKK